MRLISEKIPKQKVILWSVVLMILGLAVFVHWYYGVQVSLIEENIQEIELHY